MRGGRLNPIVPPCPGAACGATTSWLNAFVGLVLRWDRSCCRRSWGLVGARDVRRGLLSFNGLCGNPCVGFPVQATGGQSFREISQIAAGNTFATMRFSRNGHKIRKFRQEKCISGINLIKRVARSSDLFLDGFRLCLTEAQKHKRKYPTVVFPVRSSDRMDTH